jgi:hypothetical protein
MDLGRCYNRLSYRVFFLDSAAPGLAGRGRRIASCNTRGIASCNTRGIAFCSARRIASCNTRGIASLG